MGVTNSLVTTLAQTQSKNERSRKPARAGYTARRCELLSGAKGSEPARDTTGFAGFAASARSIDEDDDLSIGMAMAVIVVHVVIVVVVCKPVDG
jgi:hypothetical protein